MLDTILILSSAVRSHDPMVGTAFYTRSYAYDNSSVTRSEHYLYNFLPFTVRHVPWSYYMHF